MKPELGKNLFSFTIKILLLLGFIITSGFLLAQNKKDKIQSE